MDEGLHGGGLHLQAERPRPTVGMLKSGVERNGVGTMAFPPSATTNHHLGSSGNSSATGGQSEQPNASSNTSR